MLLLLLSGLARPAEARRFALAIGQNVGDPGEERLRFADADAARLLEAMVEVGGVSLGDATALRGAEAEGVRSALAALESRMAREATRADQLLLYVSAHADEGELHLGGTRLPLAELNDFLRRAPVGVAMLVVDSCRSGAVTRLKGLRPVEGARVLVEAAEIAGRIVISSSGPDEYAQESDELGGSYFTHHLVAAIRGAADTSRDGRVTLQEAYSYAYARTLESTFSTPGGVQRPSYHVDLRGHGELVLSEPSRGRGRLVLDIEPAGRWQIASADGRTLVAQLDKAQGPVVLGLSPGKYRVRTRSDDGQLERTVSVPEGGEAVVRFAELEWTPVPKVAMKGGSLLTAYLGGTASTGIVRGIDATLGVEVRLHLARPGLLGPVDTAALAIAYRRAEGSRSVRFGQDELEVRLGSERSFGAGRMSFALGPEVGALLVLQSNLPDGSGRTGLEGYAGLTAQARLRLSRRLGIFLSASGGAAAVKRDSGVSATWRALGAMGVAADL
ncbi:MAG: caspase family protein [Myxococcales bacterium]|nr:caspase family protein [Myxococcales bacterium]